VWEEGGREAPPYPDSVWTSSESGFPTGLRNTVTHKHQGEKTLWERKPASTPFHLTP
jgi:hypothetical protein